MPDPFNGLSPEEYQRRRDERDAARMAEVREWRWSRKVNQGEVACPMVISDSLGVHGVQSMLDGKHYDSKSRLRATYRAAGFVEVGNDVDTTRNKAPGSYMERDAKQREVKAAVGKALSAVDTMSDETVKRRAWERQQTAVKV